MIIEQIIDQIPFIISFVICGYIFQLVYSFVRGKVNPVHTNHVFLKSVIIGYIVITLSNHFLVKLGKPTYVSLGHLCLICGLCVIVAFAFAKFINSRIFNRIISFIGIPYTTNGNIWNDVIKHKTECWIYLTPKNNPNIRYSGLFKYAEQFTKNPTIALSHYEIEDYENTKKSENHFETEDVILIDTQDFNVVEIVYGSDHRVYKKIHNKIH